MKKRKLIYLTIVFVFLVQLALQTSTSIVSYASALDQDTSQIQETIDSAQAVENQDEDISLTEGSILPIESSDEDKQLEVLEEADDGDDEIPITGNENS